MNRNTEWTILTSTTEIKNTKPPRLI